MLNRREFLKTVATVAATGAQSAWVDGWDVRPRVPIMRPESQPTACAYSPSGILVGRVTGQDALVHLFTPARLDQAMRLRVRYAESTAALETEPRFSPEVAIGTPATPVELPVPGLAPNASYVYRVEFETQGGGGVGAGSSAVQSFRSQKTSSRSFSFSVIADPHWGNAEKFGLDSAARWNGQQCLRYIARDGDDDFVVDLGDSPLTVGAKTPQEYLTRYLDYRALMTPIGRKMPFFFVLGNHEQEAGFFQYGVDSSPAQPTNHLDSKQFAQKWSTHARHRTIPNPRGDTYPEGGEGATGYDSLADWLGREGPWNTGAARRHLQNFYAWSWGDALFLVLDPYRYTLVGSMTRPNSPSQYTLGRTQLQWLEDTLAKSTAAWRFVFCHHQVGGGLINRLGRRIRAGGEQVCYGRGSAAEIGHPDVEQTRIHKLLQKHGVQFFVYGHDHAFAHSVLDDVNYVCCARPTALNRWWVENGMRASYGHIARHGAGAKRMKSLYNVLGFMRLHVEPSGVTMQWIRTGFSFGRRRLPIATAERDYREAWFGRSYPVDTPALVRARLTPTDVDAVRTVSGARFVAFGEPPKGKSYYRQPNPARPEEFRNCDIPLEGFPESSAVVDTVPEIVREVTFRRHA